MLVMFDTVHTNMHAERTKLRLLWAPKLQRGNTNSRLFRPQFESSCEVEMPLTFLQSSWRTMYNQYVSLLLAVVFMSEFACRITLLRIRIAINGVEGFVSCAIYAAVVLTM